MSSHSHAFCWETRLGVPFSSDRSKPVLAVAKRPTLGIVFIMRCGIILQIRMSLGTSATCLGRAVSFEPQHGESRPHVPDHGCVRGPYTATDTCVRGFYQCQQSIFEGYGVAVAWFRGARSSPPHERRIPSFSRGSPIVLLVLKEPLFL